ncbi:pyocin knob domain-containing protein, partial [Pseudophaeobacter sp.]|uniref:pyocin knob domain-containing protein n=1 Tax=Pseudophaeobacter sp. TaxID=1971739 RepID=UPI003296980C
GQNYRGATASNQFYAVVPTMAMAHQLLSSVQGLLSNYQTFFDTIGQYRLAQDLMFQADQDTGLTNPAENAVGLQAGDVLQLMLAGGVASGAAVQSGPLDVTPGKIPLVGAFGWGEIAAPVPNDNIDNIVASGNYLINAQVIAASADIPPCSSGSCLLHLQYNSSNAAQLFFSHGNNLSYHRIKDAGVWSDWKALNAASGNNANGEWVRLPNGTQICTNQAFQTSDTADTTWTYPASFLYPASPGRPAVSGAASALSSAPAFLSIGGISGSGTIANDVAVRAVNLNGDRVALAASLIAIGRWF